MAVIDSRLIDPNGIPEISENFNRVLNLVDKSSGTPGPAGPPGEDGAPGPAGKDGVGITSITGSIDGENNLTIIINLTEGEPQTITGKITPPAAP